MRNLIKWAIWICHRQTWFCHAFANLLITQLTEINQEAKRIRPKVADRPDQPNCLVLHSDLFRGDLEALAASGKVRILTIPTGWQQTVHQAFYPKTVEITDYYNAHQGSELSRRRESVISFLKPFFGKLNDKFSVNFVIAPNFRHVPDLDWGAAGQAVGMLDLVLFREGLVNFPRVFAGLLRRQEKFGRLRANFLFLTNRHIKRVMTESGFADESQMRIVGTPRMDRLVRRAGGIREQSRKINIEKISEPKIVVLYSSPGKFQKGFFDDDGLWRPPGLPQHLFFQIFETIFEFARDHQSVEVLIKVKKDRPSIVQLKEAFPNIAQTLIDQGNLRIECDVDLHLEMERASALVGLNSTAVLESGLFGRRVIVPFLREFRDSEWSERFGFKQDLAAFDVPEDQEDFRSMLEQCLVDPMASEQQVGKRLELFDDWVSNIDGSATKRCVEGMNYLLNQKRAH